MHSTKLTQTVPLGALIAAVYDQSSGLSSTNTGTLATNVLTDLLLRTGNVRALRALQALATESR